MLDARPDRVDLRDRPYLPRLISLPPNFPDAGLIKRYFPKFRDFVMDQGRDGACTGYGLASVVNFLLFRQREERRCPTPYHRASPAMLYRLARMYDEWPGEDYEGSSCRGAMKGWHKHGVCSRDTWDHKPGKISRPLAEWRSEAARVPLGAYYRIDKGSLSDMQSAIHEVGAIYVAARIHGGWSLEKAKSAPPLIAGPPVNTEGVHAFAIVGYNAVGFIVQNSWGPGWGYNGFAILSYDDWIENGVDAWVAVLGAPMESAYAPVAHSPSQLVRQTACANEPSQAAVYALHRVSLADAYLRSAILENNGRAVSRLVDQIDGLSALEHITRDQSANWLKARGGEHIAVFVQSGLRSEMESLERVRSLAPVFENNGICPLFVVWRHGLLDALGGMLRDLCAPPPPAKSSRDERVQWAEKSDYAMEATCRRVMASALWREVKSNASRAADEGGATWLMAENLAMIQREMKIKLHLLGHSAGCLLLAGLLKQLAEREAKVDSLHLLAPACPLAFANELAAVMRQRTRRALPPKRCFVDLLCDGLERLDSVGRESELLYNKSLLYFISRALEDRHKTPLLGQEAVWNSEFDGQDIFPKDSERDIQQWREFAGPAGSRIGGLTIHRQADQQQQSTALSHDELDLHVGIISQAIARALGTEPGKLAFQPKALE